jgi:Domain of unknown function (DUF1906)
MVLGLDYSFSHPDLNCARTRGYQFVARYIGDPDPNSDKYLDAAELQRIRSAGLFVVVVRETTAGFMFTDSGRTHAKASRAHCNALGLHGIPIYYALDVDPRGMNSTQRAAVSQFLADAAAADGGGGNVGIYGSDDALDWYRGVNCHWGWQTYAWSSGRISKMAHFRQFLNGQNICGGTVDLNETYSNDYGQWPRPNIQPPPEDTLSAAEVAEIKTHINDKGPYLAADLDTHPAYWVVYKQTGEKRWVNTFTFLAMIGLERILYNGVDPAGFAVPFPRSKDQLEQYVTVGPVPDGW